MASKQDVSMMPDQSLGLCSFQVMSKELLMGFGTGLPCTLTGVKGMDVLAQYYLGLVLQTLHLVWVLQTACLCVRE